MLIVFAVAGAAAATAFGFWMGAGHRLLKLEAALVVATVGLAVVPVGVLLHPWAATSIENSAERWSFPMLLRVAAALLSVAAALVHFAVIKQHADAYWLYGAFFIALGLGQLAWALLVLWAPRRALYVLGAAGNAAVIAFFVVTRTVGALLGPEATKPATIGFGDTATTVFEALIVVVSLLLLSSVRSRVNGRPAPLAGAFSLVTLVLVSQTALALLSVVASAPFVPQSG